MSSLLRLRDYQRACIDATTAMHNADKMRVANVLPTGAGKTVVFAHMAEEYLARTPSKRVLVLVHTDELVEQAVAKLRAVAPHRHVGIVKASVNEVHAHIIVASVQTLRTEKRRSQIRSVGLIIVDECHHATAPTYRNILKHFGALPTVAGNVAYALGEGPEDPIPGSVKVVGFTATLARGDKAKLSDIWEDVAYRRDIAFMIRRGYLLDVRGRRVEVPDLDLSSVKQSGGDYREGELAEELDRALAPEIVAKAYVEHAIDRRGLIFTPTVASAYHFAEALVGEGVPAEVVHGGLGREERRNILHRLTSGVTQVVVNCMVLTEGFDAPCVSCVVIARPTRSAPLYQQMVGRALRPDLTLPPAERGHALVLDVVGASRAHDLRSLVDLSSRRVPDEEAQELSLLEMEEWEESTEGSAASPEEPEPEELWRGPVETVEFDPLARQSERAWKRTKGGSYFLSIAEGGYIFLTESVNGEPGTWDVVWCTPAFDRYATEPQAATTHAGLSFEMALSWGEDEAIERGGHGTLTLTRKRSPWRKQPASEKQLNMARNLGIVVPIGEDGRPAMSKGDVSDAIDNIKASQRIDALVMAVQSMRKR